jgi:ABC-2 type transport system ATP-binding protein
MPIMLLVQHISKRYGDVVALDDVSFQVDRGQVVGLLGHNGAGKTTAIKVIAGYLQPDSGTVTVDGRDVTDDTRRVQASIGYLPESAPLYPELSVQAYLTMVAELRGIERSALLERLAAAVYDTGLQDHLTRPIGHLSKGLRQRVGLAQAILHRPSLLVLDEPSIGLDPTQIIEMRGLIKRLAQRSTVLFSTHILSEVEALCDRVVIIANGRVRADSALSELASTGDMVLTLERVTPGVQATLRAEPKVAGVRQSVRADGAVTITVTPGNPGDDLGPTLFRCAAAHGWPVCELRREGRSLEAVFAELSVEHGQPEEVA